MKEMAVPLGTAWPAASATVSRVVRGRWEKPPTDDGANGLPSSATETNVRALKNNDTSDANARGLHGECRVQPQGTPESPSGDSGSEPTDVGSGAAGDGATAAAATSTEPA